MYVQQRSTSRFSLPCALKKVFYDETIKVLTASFSDLNLASGATNQYAVTLYNDWARKNPIGTANYVCTNTNVMFETFCLGQMSFDGVGTLHIQGLVSATSSNSTLVPIIGGTGAYVGARGQAVGLKQEGLGGIKTTATFLVTNTTI